MGLLAIAASLSAGAEKFEPTWKSLRPYECPEWFKDAKFGIYVHWGIYSVPNAPGQSEWYGRNMYASWYANRPFHEKTYGALDEFGYKDFVPIRQMPRFMDFSCLKQLRNFRHRAFREPPRQCLPLTGNRSGWKK